MGNTGGDDQTNKTGRKQTEYIDNPVSHVKVKQEM